MLIYCCSSSIPGRTPWINLLIQNLNADGPIWITNLEITEGMLAHGQEICKIIGKEIQPGDPFTIYARGKNIPPTGTAGTVTLSSSKDLLGSFIADISWTSPLSETDNKLVINANPAYLIEPPVIPHSGPMGDVSITVQKNHISGV